MKSIFLLFLFTLLLNTIDSIPISNHYIINHNNTNHNNINHNNTNIRLVNISNKTNQSAMHYELLNKKVKLSSLTINNHIDYFMNESSHHIESLTIKISKLMKDIIIKQKIELDNSKHSEDKIIIKYKNINERLNNLHLSIIHLNSSLFIINDKILEDIKYLHTLEIIKPQFLHYISELHTNIDDSKNMVDNLVEGDDKEELTNLLDNLKEHSSNITNILSNLFLQF